MAWLIYNFLIILGRQLAICIRLAIKGTRDDNDKWSTHFTGYVISLLVIFYFQVEKKLPSVLSLQNGAKREQCGGKLQFTYIIRIDLTLNDVSICLENNVAFDKPQNVQICKDRLRDLLIGFFKYYANFQHNKDVISVFEGKTISSIEKMDDNKLSKTLYR